MDVAAAYPAQLLDWSGNRSGGVRRLFDPESGRPSGTVFETNLLHRLRAWASSIATSERAPRILLLVGGPGNGKTEAIEATIEWLGVSLGESSGLVEQLRQSFFPPAGVPVPRLARAEAPLSGEASKLVVSIV